MASCSTGGVYYLEKPFNSGESRGFFFSPSSSGWSEGTSTSKAVACAVISIAGSVTTQPTAQTTTSASTWSNTRERRKTGYVLSKKRRKKTWGKKRVSRGFNSIEKERKKKRSTVSTTATFPCSRRWTVLSLPCRCSSVQTWNKRETPPKQTCSLRSPPPLPPPTPSSPVQTPNQSFPLVWPTEWS